MISLSEVSVCVLQVIVALLVAAVSGSGNLLLAPAHPVAAPLLHSPFATSYANTYKLSVRAPLLHAAPALYYSALSYPYAYGRAYGYPYHYYK